MFILSVTVSWSSSVFWRHTLKVCIMQYVCIMQILDTILMHSFDEYITCNCFRSIKYVLPISRKICSLCNFKLLLCSLLEQINREISQLNVNCCLVKCSLLAITGFYFHSSLPSTHFCETGSQQCYFFQL